MRWDSCGARQRKTLEEWLGDIPGEKLHSVLLILGVPFGLALDDIYKGRVSPRRFRRKALNSDQGKGPTPSFAALVLLPSPAS